MTRTDLCLVASMVLMTASAAAQTNTFPLIGNVGIGTTSPGNTLDVNGDIQMSMPNQGFVAMTLGDQLASTGNKGWLIRAEADSGPWHGTPDSLDFEFWNGATATFPFTLTASGIVFPDGSTQTTAYNQVLPGSTNVITQNNGDVGIGTTTPSAALSVASGALGTTAGNTLNLFNIRSTNANANWLNITQIRNANGNDWTTATTRLQEVTDVTPQGYIDFNPAGGNYAIALGSHDGEVMRVLDNGNVGIGTTNPGAKLEVSGAITIDGGAATPNGLTAITFPDNTIQTTAWRGTLPGGDYAESVDVTGDRAKYEPGDVLVIDPASEGHFLRSAEAYSTSVTGVYSTRPGVVGRRQKTEESHMKDEVPMAMTGIVPVKVTAENGPIKPGDLLVTSSLLGYAMKGTDRTQMLGAVIGKSIGHLDEGTGVIEVVVTLQ